jgi:transcriptional regulator with XRE-family HTH domain
MSTPKLEIAKFLLEVFCLIERILEQMKIKNVNAKELSDYAGLNNSAITEWKKGKSKPSSDAIIRLADYFNVSADYLLGRTHESTFTASNISNSAVVQSVNNSSVTVNNGSEQLLSDELSELIRIYNSLDVKKRMKMLQFAFSLEGGN